MKRFTILSVACLLVLVLSEIASAQVCGPDGCTSDAGVYASRLNASRAFRHDRSYGGAEVIYRSSGEATEAEAREWWMNSPAHRRLLVSGAIQDVACVGNVCVGRGIQAATNVTKTYVGGPIKKLFSRLRCR
jgi:hypothetical protein